MKVGDLVTLIQRLETTSVTGVAEASLGQNLDVSAACIKIRKSFLG